MALFPWFMHTVPWVLLGVIPKFKPEIWASPAIIKGGGGGSKEGEDMEENNGEEDDDEGR